MKKLLLLILFVLICGCEKRSEEPKDSRFTYKPVGNSLYLVKDNETNVEYLQNAFGGLIKLEKK